MYRSASPVELRETSLTAHLLGLVDFHAALALQHRLVYEGSAATDATIPLLICEHPPILTIGRAGSRGDWRALPADFARRGVLPHWVARGGGCLLHAPGQLAVYPIVPLAARGWSVGEYLGRLQSGLQQAFAECGVQAAARAGRFGLWGRTGQLAHVAVAVRSETAYFGAYVNVDIQLPWLRLADADPCEHTPQSNLVAERSRPVRMPALRQALVRSLAQTLCNGRYHLLTSHPLLAGARRRAAPSVSCAS